MQEKGNVSDNTVSTIDPEEPRKNESLEVKLRRISHFPLKRLNALFFP
jgi:hypothetical protein